MAAAGLQLPATWPLILATLAVLGYACYQLRGYRQLVRCHRRLRDLRAGQRQVYKGLEAVQRRCLGLEVRVPRAERAAPYAADDEAAIALHRELQERIAQLRGGLRRLDVGPPPRLSVGPLLSGRYYRDLRSATDVLAQARDVRRCLTRAEALVDALEAVLARMAGRPAEVQRSYADLVALAEAIGEELELQRRRGAQSLDPLIAIANGSRSQAQEWVNRLGAAGPQEAPQLAIEAEAQRLALAAGLDGLRQRAGAMAGIHDHAVRALERSGAALGALQAQLRELRPALLAALRPALETLERSHQALAGERAACDGPGYQDISQQGWALVARARSLSQQVARLAEADRRAVQAAGECERGLAGLRQEVAREEAEGRAPLDLVEATLERAERLNAQMHSRLALEGEAGVGPVGDPAAVAALLAEVEALAAEWRREEMLAREGLAEWRARRQRAEDVLRSIEGASGEQQRLSGAWRDLQRYNHANWRHVEADWHDAHVRERDSILAAAASLRGELATGRIAQSAGDALAARCEALARRWQALLHDGQRVIGALAAAKASERQVREGLTALRGELQAVVDAEETLPEGFASAPELRGQAQQMLAAYRRLEEAARSPAEADYRRLRDEGIAHLHEQLAIFKLSSSQIREAEHAALKRRLAEMWEQWGALSQRLARSTPPTSIDYQELARRWEALMARGRSSPDSLPQVLELRAEAEQFAQDVARAEQAFVAERDAVRQAEVRLAERRRMTVQLREAVPRLLARTHPRIVDEEWERSSRAWRKAEDAVRHLAPQRGVQAYVARVEEAAAAYEEAQVRARSAMVRLLRYSFLEDPDGMHEACLPLGRRWGRLGVTAREGHIRDLLGELEQAGQVSRLVERVGSYFTSRRADQGRPGLEDKGAASS